MDTGPPPQDSYWRSLAIMKFPSTGRGQISVLIADSNQTQSEVLDSALRRQPGLKITRCRGEVSECLGILRSTHIDVLLLGDSAAGHESLIDVLRLVHISHPQVRFVLMMDGFDRSFVVNAMRTGARGLFDRAHLPFSSPLPLYFSRSSGADLGQHRTARVHR